MIHGRFERLPDGMIIRHCELQAELAEWVEVKSHVWERRMRGWG